MKRFHDWPSRLEDAIRARDQTPFAWGGHDCCLAACDLIAAMTGEDPAGWFRRRYKTERGAALALRRFLDVFGRGTDGKGLGLAEMLAHAVPVIARAGRLEEIRPAFAGRGDVVLLFRSAQEGGGMDSSAPVPRQLNNFAALALVDLDGRSVLAADRPGTVGWVSGPVAVARRAWRIP